MKLTLIRFSQDMDIERLGQPGSLLNFLVFRRENGSTFRIPVPEETIQALLPEVAGGEGPAEGEPELAAEPDQSVVGEGQQFERRDELELDPEAFAGRPVIHDVDPEDQTEGATEFGGDDAGGEPEVVVPTGVPDGVKPVEGVRGQIQLTAEEMREAGIDPSAPQTSMPPPQRAVPPPQRRKLRRTPPPTQQRSLIPGGDDGVPSL